MTKALFLDRDGIVNKDSAYPHRSDQIIWVDGIFDICSLAQEKGYLLIIVTNQAGIAKGKFTEADVISLHAWMIQEFAKRNICITEILYCPHHKNGTVPDYAIVCEDRKPRPGMILKAQRKYDIDLSKSIMIGDKLSDRIDLPELKSYIVKSKYVEEGWDLDRVGDAVLIIK